MKVDLSKEIIGYDGKPLVNKIDGIECALSDGTTVYLKYGLKVKNSKGEEIELVEGRKTQTIGEVLLQAVTTPLQDDKGHTIEQRTRLFELSQMFYENMEGEVELKAEDIVELKSRVLKIYFDVQVFNSVIKALDA